MDENPGILTNEGFSVWQTNDWLSNGLNISKFIPSVTGRSIIYSALTNKEKLIIEQKRPIFWNLFIMNEFRINTRTLFSSCDIFSCIGIVNICTFGYIFTRVCLCLFGSFEPPELGTIFVYADSVHFYNIYVKFGYYGSRLYKLKMYLFTYLLSVHFIFHWRLH